MLDSAIFKFLIIFIMFLPLIIGYLRPSAYLNGIILLFVINFAFKFLVSPKVIGLEAYMIIGVILAISWFVCLVLAFIKDNNK